MRTASSTIWALPAITNASAQNSMTASTSWTLAGQRANHVGDLVGAGPDHEHPDREDQRKHDMCAQRAQRRSERSCLARSPGLLMALLVLLEVVDERDDQCRREPRKGDAREPFAAPRKPQQPVRTRNDVAVQQQEQESALDEARPGDQGAADAAEHRTPPTAQARTASTSKSAASSLNASRSQASQRATVGREY